MTRPPSKTVEIDEQLAELARVVRNLAILIEEPEIAVRQDQNHRRAAQLAARDRRRLNDAASRSNRKQDSPDDIASDRDARDDTGGTENASERGSNQPGANPHDAE